VQKNDWKVALTYVGAIVGAGFASGQELVRFFVVFGKGGLMGTILAGAIFAILGALVIYLANSLQSNSYGQFIKNILPFKLNFVVDIIIAFSLWVGLGVMLIGSATLLEERFALRSEFGFIITGVLVFLCLQYGNKGLLTANTLLVPFMVVFAIGSSLIYIFKPQPCISNGSVFRNLLPNWWFASLLYVAYNMILGIVVLASIREQKYKISPWGGIWGGIILGFMSFIMVKSLQYLPESLLITEMPMLSLTTSINQLVGNLYFIGLLIAIFTTSLANAHSLATRIKSNVHKSYKSILVMLLFSTLVFIPWKFSALVGLMYPIQGYLAIPIIFAVISAVIKTNVKKG